MCKRPANVAVYRRAQAVYFSSQELEVHQIAEMVGRSGISVTRWRHEFNNGGLTGEVTALVTSKRPSKEFLDFLCRLLEDVYRGKERIYLFLDNRSIHQTKAGGGLYSQL